VQYFVDLMKEMLLACDSPWDEQDADDEGDGSSLAKRALLVPSLLKPISSQASSILANRFEGGPLAYVEFKFRPRGVFQRFISSLAVGLPIQLKDVSVDAASWFFRIRKFLRLWSRSEFYCVSRRVLGDW